MLSRVSNLNGVKNQFIITENTTDIFQSYETLICEIHHASAFIIFYKNPFEYSATTSKHFLNFLEFETGRKYTRKEVERWIKNGNTGENFLYNTSFDVKVIS